MVLAAGLAGPVAGADFDDLPDVVDSADDTACRERPFSIALDVKNIRRIRGVVTIDLHGADPDKFLKKGTKIGRYRYPATDEEMVLCVPIDKPGRYAIALYHDRNANGKFDKTWIGLPDEPYGLSNDAPARLGNPRYEEVSFDVNGPMTPIIATLSK